MGLTVEQPESLGGGGKFLDKPGYYHFCVMGVDENPADRNAQPLDADFSINASVLAGTNPDQVDRSVEIVFWKSKDKEDMANKKLNRFCLATCLIGQRVPGQTVSVEPSDAMGRQFVAHFSWKQKKNDAGQYEDVVPARVDLHYSDIWHVDDIEVSKLEGFKLDEGSLAIIPAVHRKPVGNNQPGNGPAGGGVTTTAVAPVTATRGGVDLSAV